MPVRMKLHNWFICVVNEFCVKLKLYAGVLYVVIMGLLTVRCNSLLWFLWGFFVFLVYHSKYNDHNKNDEASCLSSCN